MYDKQRKVLKCFRTAPDEKDFRMNPQCICVRHNGEVWLGTAGGGIWLVDGATGSMTQYVHDDLGNSIIGKNIYVLCDYGDCLAVGEHENDLVKFNTLTHQFAPVSASGVNGKVIRCLLCRDGKLYVGTQEGLFIIDESQGTTEQIRENYLIPNWLSDNTIYSLYNDRDGGLWIGTMRSGANYLPSGDVHMTSMLPNGLPGALGGKRIRDMETDSDGLVWIASEEGRLCVYDPVKHVFTDVPVTHYQGGTNRLGLMVQGDKVWSGIFKNGLDIIDRHSLAARHYTPAQLGLEEEGTAYAIRQDTNGKVWLGTGCGVYRQDGDMTFAKVRQLPDVYVLDIQQDKAGNMWIATIGNGLFRYQLATGKVTSYVHDANNPKSLSSNDISGILIDGDGSLWLSTDRGGLCHMDVRDGTFTSYSKAEGLPDDVVYKVLQDKDHNLWFGTNHGIVCFDPETGHAEVFNNQDVMPGNQFNYKSAAMTKQGTMLFGGSDGIVSIDPRIVGIKAKDRRMLVTNIRVDNAEVTPDGKMVGTNVFLTDEIVLPYDFSSISIDVSALDFTATNGLVYEYMLDGVDKDWIFGTNDAPIAYTRLLPGSYVLKVRCMGDDDSMTQLRIVVRHPWWSSLVARLVYLLLAIALIWLAYAYQMRRQARRQALREQEFLKAKDKELLESKINFFTYITHEIRTPLTLINGSVQNIEEHKLQSLAIQADAFLDKNLKSISKNCKRLLHLINQLLDFRRMDHDSTRLSFVRTDMVRMMRDTIERFEPAVTAAGKTISFDTDSDQLVVPIDQEAVTKILSNLLNNANKYSDSAIRVNLAHDEHSAVITIHNDGGRIPNDKADEIFKPFSRLDDSGKVSGTGLGLPLARSLAEAHEGSLRFDTSAPDNAFVLVLPMEQNNTIEMELQGLQQDDNPTQVALDDIDMLSLPQHKEYTVLVVEDNDEVAQMIVEHLEKVYQVLTATNGKQGLDTIRKQRIDLVISDVMMPVMDGVEMCRQLKQDIEINHIPIIMLTAKQALNNQLEGLRAGADAYIAKPFSFAHLVTQVDNLLANRKRERESFLHKPYLPVQGANVNKVEEEFMDKASRLIVQNISDSTFNVERLAQEMCMSRSSLHRKIKEVSDLTPVDFIRLIKLKKAAELISQEGYRTVEVCEMVGINSPSYFIKLFQKQFGMTPKEFATKNKGH